MHVYISAISKLSQKYFNSITVYYERFMILNEQETYLLFVSVSGIRRTFTRVTLELVMTRAIISTEAFCAAKCVYFTQFSGQFTISS